MAEPTRPAVWILTTVPMTLDIVLKGQPAYLSQFLDVTLVASPSPILDSVGQREGVPVVGLPMTRRITPVKDLVSVVRLWRALRRHRPAIVHAYTPKAGVVGMLAARAAGVPVRIHSVIGLPLTESRGLKQRVLKTVEAFTYRNSTHLLANGFELADHLARIFPRYRFSVLADGSVDGVDTQTFDPSLTYPDIRGDLSVSPTATVFVYVGRVVPHKGIRELTAAFTALWSDHPDTCLLVVGDLDGEAGPPQAVQEVLRTHPGIRWVGFQDDVRPYLAASDVLVLPSYREGLPQSVLEAQAMNLPAIVTDVDGCREAVGDIGPGQPVAPKDAESLRTSMEGFLARRDGVVVPTGDARERIIRRYAQTRVRSALLALYRGSLGS